MAGGERLGGLGSWGRARLLRCLLLLRLSSLAALPIGEHTDFLGADPGSAKAVKHHRRLLVGPRCPGDASRLGQSGSHASLGQGPEQWVGWAKTAETALTPETLASQTHHAEKGLKLARNGSFLTNLITAAEGTPPMSPFPLPHRLSKRLTHGLMAGGLHLRFNGGEISACIDVHHERYLNVHERFLSGG
jgi:hypothetical protein